jgi:hypothetical protein
MKSPTITLFIAAIAVQTSDAFNVSSRKAFLSKLTTTAGGAGAAAVIIAAAPNSASAAAASSYSESDFANFSLPSYQDVVASSANSNLKGGKMLFDEEQKTATKVIR